MSNKIPILSVYDENGNRIPIPAIKGDPGKTPIKGTDYFTPKDKAEMVAAVLAALPVEQWIFTLEDGSEVTKAVYVQ
jgi:hypothetical protein